MDETPPLANLGMVQGVRLPTHTVALQTLHPPVVTQAEQVPEIPFGLDCKTKLVQRQSRNDVGCPFGTCKLKDPLQLRSSFTEIILPFLVALFPSVLDV